MSGNLQLLQEYTVHLHAERNLSANTVLAYSTDLLQFAEQLEARHAQLIAAGTADVAAFVEHLATHDIGPRSRARKIAALRRFYGWLVRLERLDADPTRLTVLPKVPRLLPRPIARRSLDRILKRATTRALGDGATPQDLRDCAVWEVLYSGGVRVSELCGLREDDVDLGARTAIVRGKGDKERIVPLGETACAAIEEYSRIARPQLLKAGKGTVRALFLSEQGTAITRRRVHQIVRRDGGKDEHAHPHRIRHSCATAMLQGGADLRLVQELLGHSTLATTQIYTEVSKGHLQDAHRRFHPRG